MIRRRVAPADGETRSGRSGQIVVIFGGAMLLFVLLAAVVIDLSWYWTNNLRMQRAADAAALAGVVFLPGDTTSAYSVARSEATKNGYTNGVGGVSVTPLQDPTDTHRLRVSISGPIGTFFARVIGIQSWPARRDAKADFVLPVPMGSPENYYGVFGLLRHPGGGVTTTSTSSGSTTFFDPTTTPAGNWTNPANANIQDPVGSEQSATKNSTTNPFQLWGNFGITLPSGGGVAIDGITVDVNARSSDPSGCVLRAALNWTGTTNPTSTSMTASQTINLGSSYSFQSLGSPTQLWGRTWTPAELSNANFRVRLEYVDTTTDSCAAGSTTFVEHVHVRVHWTQTATTFTPDSNVDGPGGQTLTPRGFWGVMHGSGAEDINGDAYLPYYSQRTSNTNAEYEPVGHYNYAVEMPPNATNGHVWVFDPVMCAVGSDMGTGDRWFGGNADTPVWSFYDLYDTNNTLQNLNDDTLVATSGNLFKTQNALTDPSMGGPDLSNGRVDCTTSGGSTGGNAGGAYHNAWYQLPINLTGGANGTVYRLHTTTTDASNVAGNRNSNGQNSFSLFVEASSAGSPRVYGLGSMQQYSPLPANNSSEFYLAQIAAVHAGKTMEIRLWDIGDTPSGSIPVSLQILQPTASGWAPATMSWTAAQGTTNSGAASCNSTTGSGQTITATSGGTQFFQGCWLTILVPLPANYTAPQSGWWQIRYIVGNGSASGFDLTTWEVRLRGNPVHLVLP